MARKQFLSFLLIFSLLFSCASALAEADDDDDWDDNVDDAWEMEHPLRSGDYAYACSITGRSKLPLTAALMPKLSSPTRWTVSLSLPSASAPFITAFP